MMLNTLSSLAKNNWNRPDRLWNLAKSMIQPKSTYVSYGPIAAEIETTLVCNLGCMMCHRQELARDRKVFNMSLEDFKYVIDSLPTILQVKLQGMGEPLLTPNICDMIRYARSKGIVPTFTTNGQIMNEEKARNLIESGLARIYFSLDTANQAQYALYRRGGNLDQLIKNIKIFTNTRQALNQNKKKPLTGIWMLLFDNNLEQLIPILDITRETGADQLHIQTSLTDRGKEGWKDVISKLQPQDKNKTEQSLQEAENYAKKIGVTFFVHRYVGGMFKKTKESLCEWAWKSIYITSQGDTSPCCIIADPKVCGFGSLYRNDFKKIWNNKAYQDFRQSLLDGVIPSFCIGCYNKVEKTEK